MATSVFSPIHPHFFQPLLPGFHKNLTIPETFFLRHMKGSDEQKMVKLGTERRERSWEVKMEGRRFTDGWEEFAVAHDFQVGDFLLFRREGDLVFHVTAFGPSCCQIQYAPFHPEDDDDDANHHGYDDGDDVAVVDVDEAHHYDDNDDNDGSDDYDDDDVVVVDVDDDDDDFVIVDVVGDDVVIDDDGDVDVDEDEYDDNDDDKDHDDYDYQDDDDEEDHDDDGIRNLSRKKKANKYPKTAADPSDHTCFTTVVTGPRLRLDSMHFPKSFARRNFQDRRNGEIVLMNGQGRSWTLRLRHTKSDRSYIRGLRDFCRENGQKVGDVLRFKLVEYGTTPVLRFFPADSGNDNDDRTGECAEIKEKKTPSIWRASSSPSQNRFVTLTLSSYSLNTYRMRLPKMFTRVNGLNKHGQKMMLMDRDGREWPTYIRMEDSFGQAVLGKGWREFCVANSIKKGESFTLELIWEDSTDPILKFCSKV